MAEGGDPIQHRRRVRRLNPIGVGAILAATASQFGVTPDEYVGFRSGAAGRDMAAYLCRRYTARFRQIETDIASDDQLDTSKLSTFSSQSNSKKTSS